jgi:hypothetical protein
MDMASPLPARSPATNDPRLPRSLSHIQDDLRECTTWALRYYGMHSSLCTALGSVFDTVTRVQVRIDL